MSEANARTVALRRLEVFTLFLVFMGFLSKIILSSDFKNVESSGNTLYSPGEAEPDCQLITSLP
jgi:hypothetical protein